jgi:HAMP domain-containing protein
MSTGLLALAWIGLAVLAVVGGIVHLLLNRVLRPLREIKRNADEILASGLAIARNLDGLDEAARTRELANALPDLVGSAFGGKGQVEWSR